LAKKGELFSSLFSIKQISGKIKNGDISPVDLAEVCLNRIEKLNPLLNSFITVVDEQQVFKQAEISEKEIKQGNYLGPLHGIPFSVKDMFHAKGVPFTAGSKLFGDNVSQKDSIPVKRMKDAGAVLIGTNNLNEFASGITGKNPFYGDSKNPWDQHRISGGSSGGSAVAVATGMALVSLGTDTGGSIRVPSSLCGVVGLKPTHGLISNRGVFPLSPSLDHVGWITKSVWDSATVLNCLSKKNSLSKVFESKKKNPASVNHKNNKKKEKTVLGIPENYFNDYLDSEVEHIFNNFVKSLSPDKIGVESIKLHDTERYHKTWRTIRLAEASEIHLAWLKSRPGDYSSEVRKMLVDGTKISAIEYLQAMNTTKEIRKEFLSILHNKIDALIVPTTIIPAPRLDEDSVIVNKGVLMEIRESLLRNTITFNSIGLPAVSVPLGLTKEGGLPAGLQIVGPPYGEDLVLSIACYFESVNGSAFKSVPQILNVINK
jgi:aspartyl-tRNA(Asn)/glutamyl-tRNA(Gln) amidotransferase subunit A